MQKPTTPMVGRPVRSSEEVDGARQVLGGPLEVERHHELAGFVGLVGVGAVVEVGGQGDEALGGEALAHVFDVGHQTPVLLDDQDTGAAAAGRVWRGSPMRSSRCWRTPPSHPCNRTLHSRLTRPSEAVWQTSRWWARSAG